jgi:hypothetical protein
MEYKMHNPNLLSMKRSKGEIDIANSDLDNVFNKCIERSNAIYFKGYRPLYKNEEVNLLLKRYSESIYADKDESAPVYKITPGCLAISRNGFKQIWEHYDSPVLFFMDQANEKEDNGEILSRSFFIDEIVKGMTKTLVLYRGIESDVLWMKKSGDVMFPDF